MTYEEFEPSGGPKIYTLADFLTVNENPEIQELLNSIPSLVKSLEYTKLIIVKKQLEGIFYYTSPWVNKKPNSIIRYNDIMLNQSFKKFQKLLFFLNKNQLGIFPTDIAGRIILKEWMFHKETEEYFSKFHDYDLISILENISKKQFYLIRDRRFNKEELDLIMNFFDPSSKDLEHYKSNSTSGYLMLSKSSKNLISGTNKNLESKRWFPDQSNTFEKSYPTPIQINLEILKILMHKKIIQKQRAKNSLENNWIHFRQLKDFNEL